MQYMLDSDVCITIIRQRGGPLAQRLASVRNEDVCLSVITFAELATGVIKSDAREKNEEALAKFCAPITVLPFDERAANHYAHVRATLERAGKTIGPMDLLIAGHARALGATLVTRNTREYTRVPGLSVVDWA